MNTQLNYDILMMIAAVLMFSPSDKWIVDLRAFKELQRMFASRLVRNSHLFQFRRMTQLNFYGDGQELHDPMHLKKRKDDYVCKGPFNCSDWFFFYLLSMDVLRLETVTANFDFYKRRRLTYRARKDKSPAESLARLLLFRDSMTCMERAALFDLVNVELRLKLMTLKDTASLFDQFDRVLNINALNYEIRIEGPFTNFVFPLLDRVVADRTKDICVEFFDFIVNPETELKNFPHKHLRALTQYILPSCADLGRLCVRFRIDGDFVDEDFEPIAMWIHSQCRKLYVTTLEGVNCGDCELIVTFQAFFPDTTLAEAVLHRHPVTMMGDHYEGDDWQTEQSTEPKPSIVISRQLSVSAKCAVRYRLVGIHENENDRLQDDGNHHSEMSDYSFQDDFSDDEEDYSDWS